MRCWWLPVSSAPLPTVTWWWVSAKSEHEDGIVRTAVATAADVAVDVPEEVHKWLGHSSSLAWKWSPSMGLKLSTTVLITRWLRLAKRWLAGSILRPHTCTVALLNYLLFTGPLGLQGTHNRRHYLKRTARIAWITSKELSYRKQKLDEPSDKIWTVRNSHWLLALAWIRLTLRKRELIKWNDTR